MAIVHADNFSIYGTNAALMLNGIYASAANLTLVADPDGLSGGRVCRFTGGGQAASSGIRFVLPASATKVGIAQRVWLPNLQFSTVPPIPFFCGWLGPSNEFLLTVTPTGTGRIQVRLGSPSSGTLLFTTENPVVTANGWYHIEAALDTGAGTLEVRVEGLTVVSLDSLTINPIYQIAVGTTTDITSAGYVWYSKDLVIWNGEGSFNNDFLGSVLVHNLTTASDVSLNWTPSTGSEGWSILDNIPPNDSQYIAAPYSVDPPNYPDPYVGTMTDLPIEATSVKAVITFVRAAKTDGGDGSLQVGLISDGVVGLGAERPITVAQTYWRDVFETDPATSAAWLPQAVNDANIQINRTL